MDKKNRGLTVGELTITIGVLIIAALIWTAFKKHNQNTNTSYLNQDIGMVTGINRFTNKKSIEVIN